MWEVVLLNEPLDGGSQDQEDQGEEKEQQEEKGEPDCPKPLSGIGALIQASIDLHDAVFNGIDAGRGGPEGHGGRNGEHGAGSRDIEVIRYGKDQVAELGHVRSSGDQGTFHSTLVKSRNELDGRHDHHKEGDNGNDHPEGGRGGKDRHLVLQELLYDLDESYQILHGAIITRVWRKSKQALFSPGVL